MTLESLTVRITAEASSFQRELDGALNRLSDLESNTSRLQSAAARLSQTDWFSSLERSLGRLPARIGRVATSLQNLSRIPIRLNIAPAAQQLLFLGNLASRVGAQIRSVGGGGIRGGFGSGGASIPPPTGYATGGLVRGPRGVDQVPAMLSDGEYVLRRDAVRSLGLPLLSALNQSRSPAAASAPARTPTPVGSASSTVNHFGGVTVQVQQTGDVQSLLRDLRLDAIRTKNRRG